MPTMAPPLTVSMEPAHKCFSKIPNQPEKETPMATQNNPAAYNAAVHFRAPDTFMPAVHLAARRQGLTAASFMRQAILKALYREGVIQPEQDAA